MTDHDYRTRIAIVDDHALFREGLREILKTQSDMVVVGEAGDSASAIAMVAQQKPHIVLLDVEIPGDDVTVTVNRIRRLSPYSKIIILSIYDGPQLVRSLLRAGVGGYLLKTIHCQDLLTAIRTVHAGEGRIILEVSRESLIHIEGPSSEVLSRREKEVLELTAQALSNAQIGTQLGLAEGTVKRHLRNIFVKLGAVSRIDAVNKATAASIISVGRRDSAPHPGSAQNPAYTDGKPHG
jgi:DNA-binding NarL/FixJ family response regulator